MRSRASYARTTHCIFMILYKLRHLLLDSLTAKYWYNFNLTFESLIEQGGR